MITSLDEGLAQANTLILEATKIRRIVLSGKQRSKTPAFQRIDIRPVEIKASLHLQIVSHDGTKDITKNVLVSDFRIHDYFEGFGNLLIESDEEEFTLRVTKSGEAQVSSRRVVREKIVEGDLSHDRKKMRYLEPDERIFRELGISDHQGKLKPSRSDKFLQVNEFLKILSQSLPLDEGKSKNTLTVVDLGCGSAYLTFAAHQYLRKQGIMTQTLGIDSRADSKERNQAVSANVGLEDSLRFEVSEIAKFPKQKVDITIALHACDTATDDAIAWAIESESQVILVSPCCHHDIQRQMKDSPEPWKIATKHGILAERLGDLMTDAIRAQILRVLGYRTDVIEFIAGDHTPRNLMIRAIFTGAKPQQRDFDELDQLIAQWKIEPALISRLTNKLAARREIALGLGHVNS